jgi:hypothetical protein
MSNRATCISLFFNHGSTFQNSTCMRRGVEVRIYFSHFMLHRQPAGFEEFSSPLLPYFNYWIMQQLSPASQKFPHLSNFCPRIHCYTTSQIPSYCTHFTYLVTHTSSIFPAFLIFFLKFIGIRPSNALDVGVWRRIYASNHLGAQFSTETLNGHSARALQATPPLLEPHDRHVTQQNLDPACVLH